MWDDYREDVIAEIIQDQETLIKENTTAIYIETPGTYTFEIIDIEEVIRVCKKYKLKSIIDNTWATALYFNPLEFGVDIVIVRREPRCKVSVICFEIF